MAAPIIPLQITIQRPNKQKKKKKKIEKNSTRDDKQKRQQKNVDVIHDTKYWRLDIWHKGKVESNILYGSEHVDCVSSLNFHNKRPTPRRNRVKNCKTDFYTQNTTLISSVHKFFSLPCGDELLATFSSSISYWRMDTLLILQLRWNKKSCSVIAKSQKVLTKNVKPNAWKSTAWTTSGKAIEPKPISIHVETYRRLTEGVRCFILKVFSKRIAREEAPNNADVTSFLFIQWNELQMSFYSVSMQTKINKVFLPFFAYSFSERWGDIGRSDAQKIGFNGIAISSPNAIYQKILLNNVQCTN